MLWERSFGIMDRKTEFQNMFNVIYGNYGNSQQAVQLLQAAGYGDKKEAQKEILKILKANLQQIVEHYQTNKPHTKQNAHLMAGILFSIKNIDDLTSDLQTT